MPTTIFCQKLNKESEQLDRQPYPGPLGQRIHESICAEAWSQWLNHQTMLINEYRLNPLDPNSRSFLEQEMEKYFFGDGADLPAGYVKPKSED